MLQLVCTRVCVCVCVCVCVYWRWQDGEYYGEELDRKYRASIVAQLVKSPPAMLETWVRSLGWEDSWRRKWQPTPVFLPEGFHGQRAWWDGVYGVTELCVGHN